MAEAALHILEHTRLGIGRTVVREAQLALDIAQMLDNQATQRYVPPFKYVWLDSSPQGGKDWLLGQFVHVSPGSLSSACQACHLLQETVRNRGD
eukprot:9888784-Lingulodinium_polyedra.AAC.1